MRRRNWFLGITALAAAAGPGCGPSGGLKFRLIDHVVTGKVLVKGKPGAGVKLVFVPVEGGSNAGQTYNLVAADDGTYRVNSLTGTGGPAEGEYAVCASYPTGPGKDRFRGEFNDPKTTPFRVAITPATTELEPIKIDKYDLPARGKDRPKAEATD